MDGGSTEDAGGGPFAGLGGLERWRTHTRIAIWCLILCGSVLLNATLLVAFIRRPGLRTISNRFVMNLIASNLLSIFVLTTLLITDSCGALAYTWTPSICALSEGATAFVTTSSILSVLLIGVDQYLAVVDPLRYRTRIDKLKCALLIVAVWLIACAFGTLASLNPDARSLCSPPNLEDDTLEELEIQASFVLNDTELDLDDEIEINSNNDYRITYGLVYAIVYAVLGYLTPFLAMCWIYVSIYMAARNNSERTRRNGSRPVLTSGSFSEESGYSKPDSSMEEIRRLPKISSLSSIDENSEATPSQVEVPIADAVVFTVGSTANDNDEHNNDAKDDCKVPIADVYEEHPYEYDDQSSDEEPEEAKPLSTEDKAHSISVNFDLADHEGSKMLQPPPIVTITPPGPQLHRVPSVKSTHSYINNLKYRISNGSLFKYREETRAARISALVIVMGLICWTPYVYVLLHKNLEPSVTSEMSYLDATALYFLVLATYVSPLLFGYRSKRVKRELRKFFCFRRELSYKNNRSLMAKKVLRRRHSGVTILGQLAGEHTQMEHSRYNIFNCVYGRNRWPKEKVQFVQVPETALAVETCRSSFSSGASTQISSTSTDEC